MPSPSLATSGLSTIRQQSRSIRQALACLPSREWRQHCGRETRTAGYSTTLTLQNSSLSSASSEPPASGSTSRGRVLIPASSTLAYLPQCDQRRWNHVEAYSQASSPMPPPLLPLHPVSSSSAASSSSPPMPPPQQFSPSPSPSFGRPRSRLYLKNFSIPPDMSKLPPEFGKNQHMDIDAEVWERLKGVVDTFHHKAPIRYAFAYGSGVFSQKGYDGQNKPMVDFVFGVTHPQHWHALNLQANPHHYSFLGKLGSKAVAMTQERFGAGVYFNPFVEVNGMIIKYGVVSIDTLCNDLLNWETMYVSGRLHKPVKILLDDPRTRLSNQVNLFNATRVSLLSLPKRFTSEELFTKIASLSYMGDFRMSIGENPHKVKNIVEAQLPQFHRLYDPLLASLSNVTVLREGHLEQDDSPLVRSRAFQKLPPRLKEGVRYRYHSALSKAGVEIVNEDGKEIQSVATAPDLSKYLSQTIHSIIQIPALTQSIKGIATAGVVKTGKYGLEKLGKWWTRKQ
ncbi:Mitochondrial translocator assembly and maintenance protein 41 [Actinomortierella ambigua]|uniref:Phosphatidate cytidylyltransferase, mitochondrial n=1 Tax=Actinomortierella ambigua TaxID=1343610 RepID=A0A9P6QGS2_9FUNG|nr:Mitochondrial translocator assembly and maintenance protein 41 [Actinomortierella ambigua]